MHDIPTSLRRGPFTSSQALEAGLTRQVLRGRRFRRLYRDVYVDARLDLTPALWIAAARLVLPSDAVASHTTALHLHGVRVGRSWPMHFSTNFPAQMFQRGIVLHRRQGWLTPFLVSGVPTVGPDRALVDSACHLGFVELVTAADWLIHAGCTSYDQLFTYAHGRHLHGVQRTRRALPYVRENVESPKETVLRLMIVFARLPEPVANLQILDRSGRFIARGDLVYETFKVLVEYDGVHHERDPAQRQRDRERREQLEAAGWRVIVVTSQDLKDPRSIPWRVFKALKARGYAGPPPRLNTMWSHWF